MALPRNIVKEDHRLEKAAEQSSTALAELRWHWTLDESNPDRVSIRQYARDVSRAESSIRNSANTRERMRAHPDMTMSEASTRTRMADDRFAATKAVADARGVTVRTAETNRRNETRRVQQIATEKAEKKGTSIEEEAPAVAEWIVKSEKAAANVAASRAKKTDLRLIEVEAKALRMIRQGAELVALVRAVDWDDEAVELIEDSIANIKSMVDLIDIALVGAADVDWDAELAKLTGGDE